MLYAYSIYDADPNGGGDAWPHADGVEIGAASAEEGIRLAGKALDSAAMECDRENGYADGQTLYLDLFDEDGILVATLTHTLTAEDLGGEEG